MARSVVTLEPKSVRAVQKVGQYGSRWVVLDSKVNPFNESGFNKGRYLYLRPFFNCKEGRVWVRTQNDPDFEMELS